MGRTLIWVVAAAGLAAAGWFLFGTSDGIDAGGEYAADDGWSGDGEVREDAPGLHGSGGVHASAADGGPRRFVITGRVVDQDGAPVPDVRVVARYDSKARIPGDPSSWQRSLDDTLAEVVKRVDQPPEERRPIAAEGTADADGTFTLRVARAAQYHVQALPDAPGVGPHNNVSVHAQQLEAETTLVVLQGAPLIGTVVDGDDKPIAARVTATYAGRVEGTFRFWAGATQATDPSDGSWRFDAVPHGNVTLEARLADGRRITGLRVSTPREEPFVIRVLGGEARIAGSVVDADGAPVQDALVILKVGFPKGVASPGSALAVSARTDAGGSFTIHDVPPGTISGVEAVASGFLPYAKVAQPGGWTAVPVPLEGEAQVHVELERGGTVVGVLTTLDGKTPIAGGTVQLLRRRQSNQAQGFILPTATTDAGGRYRIENVPKGTYVAYPEASGYYLPHLARTNTPGGFVSVEMAESAATAPPDLSVLMTGEGKEVVRDLKLGKGVRVTGTVQGPEGEGVSGAEVFARGYGLLQMAWRWGINGRANKPLATSGSGGRFVIESLPPGEGWVLYGKKERYAGVFSDPFTIVADAEPDAVALQLAKGGVLRGRIEGLSEGELAAAQVGYWGQGQELAAKSNGHKVDADGTFEITGVPPGDWTMHVWAQGRQGPQVQVRGLEGGEVREDIVLSFKEGVVVAGRVTDREGEPVANLNLSLNQRGGSWVTAMTDADGNFRFGNATEGSTQIMTWGPNGRQIPVGKRFNAPADDLELTYDRPKTVVLRGEVQAVDGTAIAVCNISVSGGASGGPMPVGGNVQEAIGGTFELQTSGDGPWTITATNARGEDGKALNFKRGRTVVRDPKAKIVLRLEPGARIAGRVLGPDGKGLAGVRVIAGRVGTQTEADGTFAIEGLDDGNVTVQVQPPGDMVRPRGQTVKAGTEDVEFRLEAGLSIKGKALGPDGKPLSQGYAQASWEAGGGHPKGGTGAQLQNGAFEIKGIPPGVRVRISVQVWSMSGEVAYAPAVVENVAPGTHDIEVQLGGGLTIEGRVVDHDGKPPSQCFIYGRSKDGKEQTGWVQLKEDGSFKLGGLKPVAYNIQVHRQDGGGTPPPTTVTPPQTGVVIKLPRSVSFSGRLEGLGSESAEQWRIRVYGPNGKQVTSTRPQADGSWEIASMAELPEVYVGAAKVGDDRYARAGPVKSSASGVVLRLARGKSISGVVEGAVVEGRVRASVWAEGTDGWISSARVERDGSFTIRGLPEGTYTVKARTFGQGSKSTDATGIRDGATGVSLDLR